MRLDTLIRLIEAADSLTFREIALKCLSLKGYKDPTLRDGTDDGGNDLQVFQLPPNPTNLAVQISVGRDWSSKLKSDATKVKAKLRLDNLILVSSRRIAEVDFQDVAEDIWRTTSVKVSRIDSQSIASTFFNANQTTEILKILDIPISSPPQQIQDDSARLDAAYSFVFFGKAPGKFREKMVESAIISYLARFNHPVDRSLLIQETREILQFGDRQSQIISGTVDRMLQRGDLLGGGLTIALNPRIYDAAVAMYSVKEQAWKTLRDQITNLITRNSRKRKIADTAIDAIMDDLGALLIAEAQATASSSTSTQRSRSTTDAVFNRLRHLHATLDTIGFPEGKIRDQVLEQLADTASNSAVGKDVLAGELFLALSSIPTPNLIKALGSDSDIEVFLDSSVAIPILGSLLFAPSPHRYFVAAEQAYRQLNALAIPMYLPDDYLEEVATHLIEAQTYEPVIDLDPDLTASENAFVSHYASLIQRSKALGFSQYLEGFGFNKSLRKAEFYSARDALKPTLERLFSRYGIRTARQTQKSRKTLRPAEESVARAIHSLGLNRRPILLEHDSRIVSLLHDQSSGKNKAVVLCTWDKVHFKILDEGNIPWDVMNPAALGDILSLTSSSLAEAPVRSPLVIAKAITEEASQVGGVVWDTLVEIEKGNLYDAELLAKARKFKLSFLRRKGQGLSSRDIAQAWIDWKEGKIRSAASRPKDS